MPPEHPRGHTSPLNAAAEALRPLPGRTRGTRGLRPSAADVRRPNAPGRTQRNTRRGSAGTGRAHGRPRSPSASRGALPSAPHLSPVPRPSAAPSQPRARHPAALQAHLAAAYGTPPALGASSQQQHGGRHPAHSPRGSARSPAPSAGLNPTARGSVPSRSVRPSNRPSVPAGMRHKRSAPTPLRAAPGAPEGRAPPGGPAPLHRPGAERGGVAGRGLGAGRGGKGTCGGRGWRRQKGGKEWEGKESEVKGKRTEVNEAKPNNKPREPK